MSIASEISRLNTAKADIKAVLEGKGIPVSSTLKIDGYAELIDLYLVPDTRVAVKYNVTDTSNPTQICYNSAVSQFSEIEIDGVVQPSVVSSYTFSTTGIHIVWFTLADTTTIGNGAFYNCSSLISVSIPNGVTSIESNVFYYCSGLTSVTIPNSVTSIGERAFSNCPQIATIVVESGNSVYDSRDGCNAIIRTNDNTLIAGCKNTIIPNSVTSIGDYAFSGCSGLTSVTIPNSVTSIGAGTFYGCSGLTSVTIPNSVTSIGEGAFNGTPWYNNQPDGLIYAGKVAYSYKGTMPANTDIVIEDGTLGIAGSAFWYCSGLTSVTIPNSVTSIGGAAFQGCSRLTSITIPSSVTSIESSVFRGCTGLTSVTIPNSVTSIGGSAFMNCYGLTSITIPNSVTSIGNNAFYGCSGLTSVTIGNSVTSIGNHAFRNCSGLTSITSLATTAPTITSATFRDVKTGGTLYVPSGSTGYDVWMGNSNYYLDRYYWTKVEQ